MRILFAWEMGHNFGHAAQIAVVAKELARKRGVEIWLALKTPAAGMAFAKDFPCRIVQAPYHPLRPNKNQRPPLTYAEGLLPCGYDSADNLHPLIESWRALFDLVKPVALVSQAAPTAQLAARGQKFPVFALGKGFDMPPLVAPMAPLRYWQKNDEDAIKRREVEMIRVINESLARAKMKPIKMFYETLHAKKNFLCCFKELDHYRERPETAYYGPIFETGAGEKIEWRKDTTKRIFAYMRPGPPVVNACAEALRKLPAGYDVVVASPGLSPDMAKKLETPSLRIVTGAVKLDGFLKKADLAIHHGGGGLVSAAAIAGVPTLMLPLHIEQLMSARAVGRASLGLALIGQIKPADVGRKIQQIITDEKFRNAAQDMAKRYKAYTSESVSAKVAAEIWKIAR